MKRLITAWENRNTELHGESGVSKVCKERLTMEIRELQALKDKARPKDAFMFIADVDKYLEKATVYSMTTYLAITKKAILNSVKKWKRRYEEGVVSVMDWLQNVPGNKAFVRLQEKRSRKLWEDGCKKERRCQKREKSSQRSIVDFLSLIDAL